MIASPRRFPDQNSSERAGSARLRPAPRQAFDTLERDRLARELTINPWPANQNHARKLIYYETSRVRQRINGEEPFEPWAAGQPKVPAPCDFFSPDSATQAESSFSNLSVNECFNSDSNVVPMETLRHATARKGGGELYFPVVACLIGNFGPRLAVQRFS
ncbi:hypothetical protein [Halomonas sp. LBP4]|uniref:hypothetical protein n=1 Tax=Halomonas sp. LBP4 TaxID=2044917 RepID=UPI0011B38070|nr:hypothetical protein [Halomonas sp. LBP4]